MRALTVKNPPSGALGGALRRIRQEADFVELGANP